MYWKQGLALVTLLLSTRGAIAQRQGGPASPRVLHAMFQDHGVLQRDQPIKIYGDTTPGAEVAVTLGTASSRTRAGSDGRWSVTLPAMAAGGPYSLTATAHGETATASDVLVGDVFFCSGQSNMAFSQRQADGAAEDARAATDAQIRQLTVAPNASLTPVHTLATGARWVVGSPETVGGFSAACYYFARELKKTANAPIGIVAAAYGGARLRTFMSETALRTQGAETSDLDLLDAYRMDRPAAIRQWGAKWEAWWIATHPTDGKPWLPDYDDRSWTTAPSALGPWALWNGGTNPDGFIGQMWMRNTVALTAEQAAKADAALDLGTVSQEDDTWVNGTYIGATSFASRTRYALPPGVLKAGTNTIVTNIYCGWRDCGMRGPAGTRAVRFGDGTSVPLANGWKAREVPEGVNGPQLPWGPVHGVTLDHNGMVLPVGAYTFRGAVWYQGESDVNFSGAYKPELLAMMTEWRRQFDNPQLPFLIVQLPGYGPAAAQPVPAPWADLREAQRQTVLADPQAALAVTIDIGDAGNLHPGNKREVGRRLAIAARHLIYGESAPPSGPIVAGATRQGADVIVSFRDVTAALALRDGGPSGFELCGATQASCRWADARVTGATVVLANAAAATRVRYAWGASPVSPLSDGSGLPAGPFEVAVR
jgi:sialate O-acetylesterase